MLLALGAAAGIVLLGPVGLQAALDQPSPGAVGTAQVPDDGHARHVEFGLGSLSVRRDGVSDFGTMPGGLRVLSADLATGSYELSVDEPGERDAGFLSLNVAFAAEQLPDEGAAPLGPASVRTSLGVVDVVVLDANDRRLETRLAPRGNGLQVDVQDAGDVAYPLSVTISRVASVSKTSVTSFGEREIGAPGEGGASDVPPLEARPVVSALNVCSYLDVSAGTFFTLALGTDHLVYGWGSGDAGQLGDATIAQRAKPAAIGGLSNINAIAAGGSHGVALDASGVVWTWGSNSNGQLGRGLAIGPGVATPAPVAGFPPLTTIIAIAAGFEHTLAVDSNGNVWSWGSNSFGQLGDNSGSRRISPVAVLGVTGAVTVAAGQEHSLVLLNNETVMAFGANDQGQLGDGTLVSRPVAVPILNFAGVAGIAAGWKHSLAWKTMAGGRSAWSWGDNALGQLGDGTTTDRSSPGAVGALPSDVVHMAGGSSHSLAVKADGLVHAWGANFSGQVGDGTLISPRLVPSVVAGITGATRVSGGREHSLAVTSAGRVYSWGRNVEGELGLGIAALNTFPVRVLDFDLDGFLANVSQVSAGTSHSLAVKADGSVWAWGENADGQLGDGTTTRRHVPVQVMPPGSGAIAVAAGTNHSLALLSSGQVRAWGSDASGQLGNGTAGTGGRTDQLVPGVVFSTVATPLTGIVEIAAGNSFSLARNSPAGNVLAWGANDAGQCADSLATNPRQNPVYIKSGGTAIILITDIDAGGSHGLARKSDATVYAWGLNTSGQLGQNSVASPFRQAAVVSGLGAAAIGVAAGDAHSLVWFSDGSAKSFGKNTFGQLGDGTTVQKLTAVSVSIANVVEMDAGTSFSVARVSTGGNNVRAWGSNIGGRLGDGSFTQRELPSLVRDLSGVTQISAGGSHALARLSDASAWGWGEATLGQLGVDYKDSVLTAQRVNFGPNCSNLAPACNAGSDIIAACDGPTLNGSATDPDGDPMTFAWTTLCPGVTFTPNANVLNPQVFFGADCGVTCDLTLTVTDSNGAVCSDEVHVVVQDSTPPAGTMGSIAACYASVTDAENAARDATEWTDNCGVGAEYVSILGTCVATITVTAEDYCGNVSPLPIVYTTRIDAVPPVLSGVPANTSAECSNVPSAAIVTALDNCDGPVSVTFSEVPSGNLCGGAGPAIRTRTWSAVDSCGNSVSASQVITLVDTTKPVIVGVPADLTIQCGQPIPAASVSATDNCDTEVDLGVLETSVDGGCPNTYTLTRTWTAYDDCANFETKSQVITVVDTLPPTLLGVPASVSVACNAVPAMATVTAVDGCDPSVGVTPNETRLDGTCPDRYTLTRTWTATDDCNNTVVGTQIITVTDDVAPVLSGVPGPITAECSNIPPAAIVTATDSCDPAPVVTMNSVSTVGSCPQSYTLTRTWTATDRCGNSSSQSQAITVVDTTDPVLEGVPDPITVACDAVPGPAAVTATDNCGTPTVSMLETIIPGTCTHSYTLRRTWTATDSCGNDVSASQDITVVDNVAPVLVGVPAGGTFECSAVPTAPTVTATDNCDGAPVVTLSVSTVPGDCPAESTITRTWTATDACGNTSSASQVLNVVDTTAPIMTGVPPSTGVSCPSVPPPASPSAIDNCDLTPTITFGEVRTNGACADSYMLTRTWTATDDCGNSVSQSQMITVTDTTAPTIVGVPANVTVQCNAVPAPASPTASDSCDPNPALTYSEVRGNGPCLSSYTLTRTWTATDRCGNSRAAQQVINVIDTTRPVVTPKSADLYCIWPANHQYRTFVRSQFSPTITDNCTANPTWAFIDCASNQPDDAAGGQDGNTSNDCVVDPGGAWFKVRAERDIKKAGGRRYTVTIAATDDCGNTSTVTQIGYIFVPLKQPGDTCLQPDTM